MVVEDRAAADRGAVAARLLVEPLLRMPGEFVLPDWKFHCFGGEPQLLHLARMDRSGRRSVSLFTMTGCHLPVRHAELSGLPTLPLGDLPALAAVARGFDCLRVDLYWLEGRILLGELTPYPNAGLGRIDPPEFDAWMGALWAAADRCLTALPASAYGTDRLPRGGPSRFVRPACGEVKQAR